MKVSEYLSLRNINPEEFAALLSERLGRRLSAGVVISRTDKELPPAWVKVLDDIPPDPVEAAEEAGAKPRAQRAQPKPPQPSAEFNPMLAEERVAAIYSMIGRGVAVATKEPRYRQAFEAHADKCGHAWAELAKHDKHVATVLTALTAGGPWGEVLWLHLSLGFSLIVISGKVEVPFGGLVPSPEPSTAQNGGNSGRTSSPDSVADSGSQIN